MHRLFESLRPFIRGVVRNAGWVLLAAALLTAAGGMLARNLSIDSDLANLIPEDRPSVQALNELKETVGGESDVAVGITSPSFEANKEFAEALIPKALDLKGPDGESYLTRVEYKRDVEYLKDNALYFASDQELRQVENYLDEQIEQAKLEANPFYFDLDDEEEEDGEASGRELEAMYDDLVGKRYPVSPDSTTLVLRFYPGGTNTDIAFIEQLYSDLRGLVDQMEPDAYNAEMEVTLAGRLYRRLVEVKTIQNDVAGSFGTGVLAVILLVVGYFFYKANMARTGGGGFRPRVMLQELFRTPIMALVIGLPLLMSLAWTGGFAYLMFERLTLMTSTLGLVLFGLGIDFGIHFYGRYAEERAEGRSITSAAEETFVSTGQAITVGALTTASALYVLTPADFKGFSEFGAIAGTGVIFALIAMTIVMPALLGLLERGNLLDLRSNVAMARSGDGEPRHNRTSTREDRRFPAARPIVVGSVLAVVAAVIMIPQVGFQYDFGALEPDYTQYEERAEVIGRISPPDTTSGPSKRNPAYILADSQEDVPEIVEAVREKARRDTTSPTILSVESLQERFPLADTARQAKLQRIANIRDLLENNKYLKGQEGEAIDKLRRAAQTRDAIELIELPDFLRKQFTTKSGEIGTFVIIYPSVGLSDGRKSIAFLEDVGTIRTNEGEVYHAASTSLVAADMLRIMRSEAPWMVLGTFLIVALLMYLNFRSVRWAALALVPLVVGILWMLLLMEIFGLQLNFYNMIVLPAVLGIGNDAGVHLVHRYREEGWGSIFQVLRSTGEHVTIGSLTTMMGFGGLLLSFHPGLNSIGSLAVVGIGTTLLSAVVFLPALLQWFEDRMGQWYRQSTDDENGGDRASATDSAATVPTARTED
ncbi:transporter [Longibacter salinarum]|uniref:Transporter n=1 Tax=Longibacter salinarum TaxID=1850348 RepID=A0A2A8CV32_9BACT|nr:MMPL family transporter [Longibacter salinarum]PEN12314.1 transporter [Longibacter salinarum]